MALTLSAPKFNVAKAADLLNNDLNQAQKMERFEMASSSTSRLCAPNSPLLERRRAGSMSNITIPTIIRTDMGSDTPLSPLLRSRTGSMCIPKICNVTVSSPKESSSPTHSPGLSKKTFVLSHASSLIVNATPPSPRTTTSNTTSLSPTVTSPTDNKKMSRRVNLGPGCGMLDWVRLGKKNPDLAGTGGKLLEVTPEELAKHNTQEDAWTCIRGKVYNMTPYFKFHPGGKDELLKAAGIDSTILFDEVHSWVNVDRMLKKCMVGTLVATSKAQDTPAARPRANSLVIPKTVPVLNGLNRQAITKTETESTDGTGPINIPIVTRQAMAKRDSESSDDASMHTPQSPIRPPFHIAEPASSAIMVIPPSPVRKTSDASYPFVPRWDWHQGGSYISINIYTHTKNVQLSDIVVDVEQQNMESLLYIDNYAFQLNIALMHPIIRTQATIHATKVEIRLYKENPTITWPSLGKTLQGNGEMIARSNLVPKYRSCRVTSIKQVTHDTKLLTVDLPSSSHMSIPIGHHVRIKAGDKGKEFERSYTPVQSLFATDENNKAKTIQFMIKLYKDGVMSQYLSKLRQGDHLSVGNPEGTFESSRLNDVKKCVLLAAGTGFTPMARLLRQLQSQTETADEEACKVHLIFANKTEKDIPWRDDLEQLAQKNKNFTITHILSAADPDWTGLRGRVNGHLLRKHLPSVPTVDPSQLLITVCGPLPFTEGITDLLDDMSYPENCIHLFT